MRSAAKGLVETRSESFESRHPLAQSQRRVEAALAKVPAITAVDFTPRWETGDAGAPKLVVEFAPKKRTQRFLEALSLGMALLVAASAWAILSSDVAGATAFLLPMITVLAILGFPFLVLGLASSREADESRIRKAVRVALLDEEERLPPQQRWQDED